MSRAQGEKVHDFAEGIAEARERFAQRVGETERAVKRKSIATMNEGESRMNRMKQNMSQAKLLFEVDVRFARRNLVQSQRNLRRLETRIFERLTTRRETELRRARAKRKVAAVRNALAIIRSSK